MEMIKEVIKGIGYGCAGIGGFLILDNFKPGIVLIVVSFIILIISMVLEWNYDN